MEICLVPLSRFILRPRELVEDRAEDHHAALTVAHQALRLQTIDRVLLLTVQPLAPTILTADDDVGTLQNVLYNGSATDDSRPLLHGTSFESNATIAIYDNGIFVTNVMTTIFGTWSWQPSSPACGPCC